MNPIRHLRINHKILLLVFILSLVSTTIYTVRSYRLERDSLMEGINEKLMVAAYSVDEFLGKDYHDRIKDEHSIPDAEYKRSLERMTEAAERFKVKYIYALMPVGDTLHFTATNATREELAKGTYDKFFGKYEDASQGLKNAIKAKRLYFEELADKYGNDRSVYIPLTTPKGKVYAVAADIPIDYIQGRVRWSLIHSLLIGVSIFIIIFICGYLVVNMISRPLQNLAGFTRELVSHEFKAPPEVESGIESISSSYRDEVGNLAGCFIFMENELQSYIRRITEATAAKERIESELRVGREIQMSVLPQTFPAFPNRTEFDLFASIEPAKEMSGDFYDYYLIKDRLYFTIGDVAGKGVPASLFMVAARTLLEAASNEMTQPEEILTFVNRELRRKNKSLTFVTVFFGILDLNTGVLDYANAGHNPPYTLHADGRIIALPGKADTALGVKLKMVYKRGTVTLAPGDCFFLYTDGVTEAMDIQEEQFTPGRLEAALEAAKTESVEGLIQVVVKDVKTFVGTAPQSDDITTLAIRYRGMSVAVQDAAPATAGATTN